MKRNIIKEYQVLGQTCSFYFIVQVISDKNESIFEQHKKLFKKNLYFFLLNSIYIT